jgi:ribosome-associated protein
VTYFSRSAVSPRDEIREAPTGVRIGTVPKIPKERLDIKFVCSPGPGGQNVNKVATKAELRFVVSEADWIPEPIRERFQELHKNRINTAGELVVTCHEERSQELNLARALKKLASLLHQACFVPKERIPTSVPLSANEERIQEKKRRGDIKKNRTFSPKDWF